MDPQVRTSFIPKKQIVTGPAPVQSGGIGILFLLSLIVFIASVIMAGGAFSYQKYLTQSIKSKSDSLARARAAFEPATIQDLTRLDKRLAQVRTLLDNHTAPSSIFDLLAASTLSNVAYSQFDFQVGPDKKGILKLHGKAPAFDAVALQSDEMNTLRMLHDVIFSGFAVNKDGGVDFDISATVDSSLTNYRNVLQAGGIDTSSTSSEQPTSAPASVQTTAPSPAPTPAPTTSGPAKPSTVVNQPAH